MWFPSPIHLEIWEQAGLIERLILFFFPPTPETFYFIGWFLKVPTSEQSHKQKIACFFPPGAASHRALNRLWEAVLSGSENGVA